MTGRFFLGLFFVGTSVLAQGAKPQLPDLKEHYTQEFINTQADLKPVKSDDETSYAKCFKKNYKYWAWCLKATAKNREINEYYRKNMNGAKHFVIGSNGQGIIPMTMFRLLPELFPQIWGTPEDNFNKPGLSKNPFSPIALPLGMAMAPSRLNLPDFTKPVIDPVTGKQKLDATNQPVFESMLFQEKPIRLNMVGFNCVACHAGKVQVYGQEKTLLGAPSNRIDGQIFLLAKTSQMPNFTADTFRNALKAKPLGWLYNDTKMQAIEEKERKIFEQPGVAETYVNQIKANGKGLLGIVQYYLYPRTHGNFPVDQTTHPFMETKRGTLNALIATYISLITVQLQKYGADPVKLKEELDARLPSVPSEVDNPSLWYQKDRGDNHWDGALTEHMHRNTGSASATLSRPVDHENISKLNQFIDGLPSDPYPFNVDYIEAIKGKKIYNQNCASCHGKNSDNRNLVITNQIIPINEIGTNPNRFQYFSKHPGTVGYLQQLLISICPNGAYCLKPDGVTRYAPNELVQSTKGYIAGRLDGIWARAPYLHNGSVPTLYALLSGQRPEKFLRGSYKYDQKHVGFQWDIAKMTDADKEALNKNDIVIYDTTKQGQGNQGHDMWKGTDQEIFQLIEYLKTL